MERKRFDWGILFSMLLLLISSNCSTTKRVPQSKTEVRLDTMNSVEVQDYNLNIRTPSDNCIGLYSRYMDFLDKSTFEITEESIDLFKSLFMTNAKVYNDISTRPSMVNFADYSTNVLYLLPNGVKARITAYKFWTEINVDGNHEFYEDLADGTRVVEWVVEKTLYNAYDSNNKEVIYEEGKKLDLKFTMFIPKGERKAYIMKIAPYEKNK